MWKIHIQRIRNEAILKSLTQKSKVSLLLTLNRVLEDLVIQVTSFIEEGDNEDKSNFIELNIESFRLR